MDFEWDEAKRQANILKHGIDFVDAVEVFRGDFVEEEDRRRDYGERRYRAIAAWRDRASGGVHLEGQPPPHHQCEKGTSE